jgi:hypothetical protein
MGSLGGGSGPIHYITLILTQVKVGQMRHGTDQIIWVPVNLIVRGCTGEISRAKARKKVLVPRTQEK